MNQDHTNSTAQLGLFAGKGDYTDKAEALQQNSPLPHRARPSDLSGFKGQQHIFTKYKILQHYNGESLILWGPPGSGKTTLANIIAQQNSLELYRFNAVLGGINDLKKIIQRALEIKRQMGKFPIIFIDEIHRFNKSQQDALLPYVEEGSFGLIGATTENPRSSVNNALLSRVHTIELKKLSEKDILEILEDVCLDFDIPCSSDLLEFISDRSNGDARKAIHILGALEKMTKGDTPFQINDVKDLLLENARDFDKKGNRHYDVISAFIKSMRGSDPDAAILWLAVMIDGGEDPVFIARRLVIFASEDVGNADPQALIIATNALTAIKNIGMPEARIILAQATSYLASTIKSNSAYMAINEALEYVRQRDTIEVPDHLQNHPPSGATPYKYPHNFEGSFVYQKYCNEKIPKFYRPQNIGVEKKFKERNDNLWHKNN